MWSSRIIGVGNRIFNGVVGQSAITRIITPPGVEVGSGSTTYRGANLSTAISLTEFNIQTRARNRLGTNGHCLSSRNSTTLISYCKRYVLITTTSEVHTWRIR